MNNGAKSMNKTKTRHAVRSGAHQVNPMTTTWGERLSGYVVTRPDGSKAWRPTHKAALALVALETTTTEG